MPASGSDKALGAVAAAAAVVILLAVQQAGRAADAGRQGEPDVAEDAQLLGGQDRQLYADRVYLGESPQDHPEHPTEPDERVVVNAGGLPLEGVWVADDAGRAISIRFAQRCTMYALPADFEAEHLYFTDPYGRWHRPFEGPLRRVPLSAYPAPGSDSGDPAWSAVLTDCPS